MEIKNQVFQAYGIGTECIGIDSRNPEFKPVIGTIYELHSNHIAINPHDSLEVFECMYSEATLLLRSPSQMSDGDREILITVLGLNEDRDRRYDAEYMDLYLKQCHTDRRYNPAFLDKLRELGIITTVHGKDIVAEGWAKEKEGTDGN